MACGFGLSAEECAILHWSPPLRGERERNGQWRAGCPVKGCRANRALEYDAPGKSVRWKSFCGEHDKEAVRPHLAAIIGTCMPGGRAQREPVSPASLEALALSGIPPQALRTQLLIWSGMTTTEALDKLGIDRTTRYRIRNQLSQFCDKAAGR